MHAFNTISTSIPIQVYFWRHFLSERVCVCQSRHWMTGIWNSWNSFVQQNDKVLACEQKTWWLLRHKTLSINKFNGLINTKMIWKAWLKCRSSHGWHSPSYSTISIKRCVYERFRWITLGSAYKSKHTTTNKQTKDEKKNRTNKIGWENGKTEREKNIRENKTSFHFICNINISHHLHLYGIAFFSSLKF